MCCFYEDSNLSRSHLSWLQERQLHDLALKAFPNAGAWHGAWSRVKNAPHPCGLMQWLLSPQGAAERQKLGTKQMFSVHTGVLPSSTPGCSDRKDIWMIFSQYCVLPSSTPSCSDWKDIWMIVSPQPRLRDYIVVRGFKEI